MILKHMVRYMCPLPYQMTRDLFQGHKFFLALNAIEITKEGKARIYFATFIYAARQAFHSHYYYVQLVKKYRQFQEALLRDRIFFNNPFQNSLEICILSSTISISLACIPSLLVTDIPFLKFDTCCLLRVHSNIVNNKRFLNDSSGICKTLAFKYCFSNYISMY